MLHFGKIPKKFGQIWRKFSKNLAKFAKFWKKTAKISAIFNENFEIRERCKGLDQVLFPPHGFPRFLGFDSKAVQRSALCRSRRELSNEYLLAKFGFDTAENEPLEVWGKIQFNIHLPTWT